jgi:hypothetical protein
MKDAGLPEEKTVPAPLMSPVVSLLLQRYVMHEKWTDCDYDKLNIFMVICDTV